jgi:hypothetical protein
MTVHVARTLIELARKNVIPQQSQHIRDARNPVVAKESRAVARPEHEVGAIFRVEKNEAICATSQWGKPRYRRYANIVGSPRQSVRQG